MAPLRSATPPAPPGGPRRHSSRVDSSERFGHAMGSTFHLVAVLGSSPDADGERMLDEAVATLERLEQTWSRFREGSDVCRVNRAAPAPVPVAPETFELVRAAHNRSIRTGGLFDPCLLEEMVANGYRTSVTDWSRPMYVDLAAGGRRSSPSPSPGFDPRVVVDGRGPSVSVAAGTGLDLGGIGKGRAADLVHDQLRRGGAAGACVNVGGDLRISGRSPGPDGWWVGIQDPSGATDDLTLVGTATAPDPDFAVATSSIARRRWMTNAGPRHHLLDPRTGRPADSNIVQATVVAPTALDAEVLAKAVLIRGTATDRDGREVAELLDRFAACALVIDETGAAERIGGFERWEWAS